MRAIALCLLLLPALACASPPQPVLYPNARLEAVGREVAEVDIEECRVLAREAGASGGGGGEAAAEIAKDTAGNAGAGAAAGAAGGAIRGHAGTGAAVGAASAGAFTVVRSGFRWLFGRRRDEASLEKRYMQRCLADRGYDVIGWK
ncbi:MAG: hypothetical protein ACQGVC_25530 [Myxococcota bacterium]